MALGVSGMVCEVVEPGEVSQDLLQKVKDRLSLGFNDHDEMLLTMIAEAIADIEQFTGVSILSQKRRVTWKTFGEPGYPETEEIPYGPVISIEAGTEGFTYEEGIPIVVTASLATGGYLEYRAGFEDLPYVWQNVIVAYVREAFDSDSGLPTSTAVKVGAWKEKARRLRRFTAFS